LLSGKVNVLGPAHRVLHATGLTDGDELLEGVRLFALGYTLLDGFALQFL
jgi:hypothetical protein